MLRCPPFVSTSAPPACCFIRPACPAVSAAATWGRPRFDSSSSAFAGNPLLISLERLAEDGWLPKSALTRYSLPATDRVDYAATTRLREAALRAAFEQFKHAATRKQRDSVAKFRRAQAYWLDDFSLYRAIRDDQGEKPWNRWPRAFRRRSPADLKRAAQSWSDDVEYHVFVQYLFHQQWSALRAFAAKHDVGLLGDVPIFVAYDSADVWAHQRLFQLDADGRPRAVSGCPPDSFSRTGQLWGHPLFDWRAQARDGFAWWVARLRATFELFDAARIDHFLGFYRYWTVPARARTAQGGVYRLSPGRELFAAATKALGPMSIVAEDLGAVVPPARELRDALGFPGMRILQNGFGEDGRYDQPHNYPRTSVAYTGTHDNQTLVGWFRGLSRRRGSDGLTSRERCQRYLDCDERRLRAAAIRALYASPASVVVFPLQDLLGLDDSARMNTPATDTGNWEWRFGKPLPTQVLSAELRGLAETYERIG
ncbi:MAG: 4-alpha-glucanotransferase [Planctomycetes bacterium]|nr:4-alpha-glucanotransferase [Planctomycetota bacterium]